MNMNRAVTRFRTPPPRNPDRHIPQGIYGAADVGISKGYSQEFFQTLEFTLARKWSDLVKKEGQKKKFPPRLAEAVIGERWTPGNTIRDHAFKAIEGRDGVSSEEIAKAIGVTTKQAGDALSDLAKRGIVVAVGQTEGRNRQNVWSHVAGTKKRGPGRAPAVENKAQKVRDFLAKNGPSTREDVQKGADLSRFQASNSLSNMKEMGCVVCEYSKERRNYVWKIVKGEGK